MLNFFQALRGAYQTDPGSLFTGFFLGLMVIMAIYNLMLFFSLRDRVYLIYVGIVVLNTFNIISLNGVGAQYLWDSDELRNDRLYVVFGSIGYVLTIWFANVFLKLKQNFPKIYKWHKVLMIMSFLLLVPVLLNQKVIYDNYGRILSILLFPSLIYSGIIAYKKGQKIALFYTIAWTPYAIGILTAILRALEVIPQLPILDYAIEFAGASEITLLSLALAYRIKVMREEITQKELEKEQIKTTILEEQKVLLEVTVNERTKELQEANATKDKFFSIVAHDLRSPMIGLQGVGQKLEYFIKKNKQEKLLNLGARIDESVDNLNHLLNNLLNWAATETGSIPFHPTKVNIKELITENINLYQSLADTKKLSVIANLEDVEALVDINTLSTVIRNVISNAIKFSPEGGGLEVKNIIEDCRLVISIADEGMGMSPAHIDAILNDGAHKSAVGAAGEKGFGLGLKLCKEFVSLNNGQLFIEQIEPQGTLVKISLPISDN